MLLDRGDFSITWRILTCVLCIGLCGFPCWLSSSCRSYHVGATSLWTCLEKCSQCFSFGNSVNCDDYMSTCMEKDYIAVGYGFSSKDWRVTCQKQTTKDGECVDGECRARILDTKTTFRSAFLLTTLYTRSFRLKQWWRWSQHGRYFILKKDQNFLKIT